MALTTNPPSHDSYVTLSEADTIASVLGSLTGYGINAAPFLAATDAVKETALRLAATGLNTFDFAGAPASLDQRLAWPRSGVEHYPSTVVPEAVRQAQVADACRLVAPRSAAQQAHDDGIQSFSLQDKSAALRVDPGSRRPAARILASAGLISTAEVSAIPVFRF
jgi:hypothetical protein